MYLPGDVEAIDGFCFSDIRELIDIKVSQKNVNFSIFENKYLVKKSTPESKIFDVIVFARRDIDSVVIPSHIKIIDNYAFDNCSKLSNISFEQNSSLEKIKVRGFSNFAGPELIVFPFSLKEIDRCSLYAIQI